MTARKGLLCCSDCLKSSIAPARRFLFPPVWIFAIFVSAPLIRCKSRNTAGVLILEGKLTTRLHGVCDRCAREFQRDVEFPISAVLVTELADEENEDEWVFQLEGDSADLDDIVTTAFVLNMDSKLLCKPDCKGLCCRCGANLNDGPCGCEPELDPRFAALKQLLKDM